MLMLIFARMMSEDATSANVLKNNSHAPGSAITQGPTTRIHAVLKNYEFMHASRLLQLASTDDDRQALKLRIIKLHCEQIAP